MNDNFKTAQKVDRYLFHWYRSENVYTLWKVYTLDLGDVKKFVNGLHICRSFVTNKDNVKVVIDIYVWWIVHFRLSVQHCQVQ